MATRGRPIPARTVKAITTAAGATPIRATARALAVSRNTVRKYQRGAKST